MTPEAAVYLRAVSGVSAKRDHWEHTQHMGRFGRFFHQARALRSALPEDEADVQIAKLAAKLEVTE